MLLLRTKQTYGTSRLLTCYYCVLMINIKVWAYYGAQPVVIVEAADNVWFVFIFGDIK